MEVFDWNMFLNPVSWADRCLKRFRSEDQQKLDDLKAVRDILSDLRASYSAHRDKRSLLYEMEAKRLTNVLWYGFVGLFEFMTSQVLWTKRCNHKTGRQRMAFRSTSHETVHFRPFYPNLFEGGGVHLRVVFWYFPAFKKLVEFFTAATN